MLEFMDYVQGGFVAGTLGPHMAHGSYEHILHSTRAILDFKPPRGAKLAINNRNTSHAFSSLELNHRNRLSGALAYLYTSTELGERYKPSREVPLLDVVHGYRDILAVQRADHARQGEPETLTGATLLYGKLYFPSQLLEGMAIRAISPNDTLTFKFVNTPRLSPLSKPTSILTLHWQRALAASHHDLVFSTHESLLGYRFLYNTKHVAGGIPSLLSLGGELWYAAATISPGASFAVRYSTYMTRTEPCALDAPALSMPAQLSPLTFTVAVNPLLGTLVSSYAVSSASRALTLCSRYTFNVYSYESNLELGAHFLRTKWTPKAEAPPGETIVVPQPTTEYLRERIREHPILQAVSDYAIVKAVTKASKGLRAPADDAAGPLEIPQNEPHDAPQNIPSTTSTFRNIHNSTLDPRLTPAENHFPASEVSAFTPPNSAAVVTTGAYIEPPNFISSFKISTSIHRRTASIAWEGKFKDWLVTTGSNVNFREGVPRFGTYGIELQYTS